MSFLRIILFYNLLHFMCLGLNAQHCESNKISSRQLSAIPDEVNSGVWKAELFHNLADVSIKKEGSGPSFFSFKPTGKSTQQGVWIGKGNVLSDYSDITITFSKPVMSVSLLFSAINNDVSGEEQIQNFKVYGDEFVDLSATSSYTWITGKSSGVKESVREATLFDHASRTISAVSGYCCDSASGCLLISNNTPFSRVIFRHQKMGYFFSGANGIVLMGINFCVVVPDEQKKNKVAASKKMKAPIVGPKKRNISNAAPKHQQVITQEKIVVLEAVLFEQSKSTLIESSYFELDRLVQLMKDRPSMKIELRGHTDNQGLQELNQLLSEQRAQKVKEYLVKEGIEESRVFPKGLGGLMPLFDNTTEENRKKNRRVEFVILSE